MSETDPSERTPRALLTERQIADFWRKVDKSGECWVWTGARKSQGYGNVVTCHGSRRDGTRGFAYYNAHRVSWVLSHGPIPVGTCVLHRCDNPPCVNPAHLFLGTKADNNRDSCAKGRRARPDGTPAVYWDRIDLGRRTDGEIALALGVSRKAVFKARKARCIPAYRRGAR